MATNMERALTLVLVFAGLQGHIVKGAEDGVVTTVAGMPRSDDYKNGTGSRALFVSPKAMSTDKEGNLYTVDNFCGTLRKITPEGVVTTVAGPTPAMGCRFGSADGTGSAARFDSPSGTALDSEGNIYVADSGNCTLRKVTQTGVVTTVAGVPSKCASVDGPKSVARLNPEAGVAVDQAGDVYVTSWNDCTVRKVTQAGDVTTVAGVSGSCSSVDGTGRAARFDNPSGIAMNAEGDFFIADETGCTIRKMTASGVVTTLAGQAGVCGSADGMGAMARFNVPSWTAVDSAGNIYVTDYLNYTVRQVTAAGVVTTLAGLAGTAGSANGTGVAARFNHPDGIAVDSKRNIYVVDRNNNMVRKITIPQ
jgi:sugar lactone lactonase YvrE